MTKRLAGVRADWRVVAVAAVLMSTGCESPQQTELDVAVSEQGLFGVSTCPAGSNIIQGTSAHETLTGTAGVDCILGNGGNDTIYGLGGDDTLIGGGGEDTLYGGDGNDRLEGETSADRLYGEAGDDKIYGSGGNDDIEGGDGADEISGLDGSDDIWGGAGNDLIRAGSGTDKVWGDDGDDVIFGGTHADTIRGGNGRDVILGEDANDLLYGEADDDYLIGGAGNNTIDGGTGNDACTGTNCEAAAPVPNGCTSDAACAAGQTCVVPAGLCIACSDGDADGTCDSVDLCAADPAKVAPGQCGCGVADTDDDSDGTANCVDGCPADAGKVAAGACGCGVADADSDSDGTADCNDGCPADAGKVAAGVCGCGVSDADGDSDGTADCNDLCPADAAKVAPGVCGCGVSDADSDSDGTADCNDGCPADAAKVAVGVCGCGMSDVDSDGDGTADCVDGCPADTAKVAAGVCGCGVADTDSDGDGTANCNDGCPSDAAKVAAGVCGCGVADTDGDSDGTADCNDGCPADAGKVSAGVCGCGVSDADGDSDGTADCNDGCPADVAKVAAGVCGCGVADTDSDGDGTPNCNDLCPADAAKVAAGICGCGVSDADGDSDGTADCSDGCPSDAAKVVAGICGCGVADTDSDGDGTANCNDGCPADAAKVAAGVCGCGVADVDGDSDGTADCNDECPSDAAKVAFGACGCGVADTDSDADGTADCIDQCPGSDDSVDLDSDGVPDACDPDEGCSATSSGPGVHVGDVWAYGPEDISFMSGISCLNGMLEIGAYTGSLAALASLRHVVGTVTIHTSDMEDLSAFSELRSVGSGLTIDYMANLQTLDGLQNLEYVASFLSISANPMLTDVSALSSLAPIADDPWGGEGDLSIAYNASLSGCAVWQLVAQIGTACGTGEVGSLSPCTGNTGTASCGTLPPEFECAPGAVGPGVYEGHLSLDYDDQNGVWLGTDPADLGGLRCVTGNVSVMSTAGTDLSILSGLQAIGGVLTISSSSLTNLGGLEALTSVGQGLFIGATGALQDLSALSNLTSLGEQIPTPGWEPLWIGSNVQLSDCWVDRLEQQLGVSCGTSYWGAFAECGDNDGVAECPCIPGADSDGDGTEDCADGCAADATKVAPGICGCGVSDADSDGDGAICNDACPENPSLATTGMCGCDACPPLPEGFDCVPGATGPGVYDGDIAFEWDYYAGDWYGDDPADFVGLTCVTGELIIGDAVNTDLSYLSQLEMVGGGLSIVGYYGTNLRSLDGLENLTYVGGALVLDYNVKLKDAWALSSLTSLGTQAEDTQLWLVDNASLPGCWAWQLAQQTGTMCRAWSGIDYTPCIGNNGTGTCGSLPANFDCGPGATGPGVYEGDVTFGWDSYGGLPSDDPAGFGGLTCVTGNLMVANSDLTDLESLSSLQYVGGSLLLLDNPELRDVDGLDNLVEVGHELSVTGNSSLLNLDGLSNLTSLGAAMPAPGEDALQLFDNPQLSACWPATLEAQTGESCGYTDGGTFVPCDGNTGTGTCAPLPPGFNCAPGATGPDVYSGSLTFAWNAGTGSWSSSDPADYLWARCVTGSVTVTGVTAPDLGFLGELQMVGGDLSVQSNPGLQSLDGLEALTHVGGLLDIGNNANLSEVWALGALESVDAFELHDNTNLPWCWVGYVEWVLDQYCSQGMAYGCSGNAGRGSCGPLPAEITCAPDAKGPGVLDYDLQIVGTDAFLEHSRRGLTCVTGDLEIIDSALTELNGLRDLQYVVGDLTIAYNASLQNVDGLDALESVGGNLWIEGNPLLQDLLGLTNLSAVDSLAVADNQELAACWVAEVEAATAVSCAPGTCDGNLGGGLCNQLPANFACVPGATGPGVYDGSIYTQYGDSIDWLADMQCVTGDLFVQDTTQTNLQVLDRLRWVGGILEVNYNTLLTSVDGLDRLTAVGGYLYVAGNPQLEDLHGLRNLAMVVGSLGIGDNYQLPQCWVDQVQPAAGVACEYNDEPCDGNDGSTVCF